MNPSSNLFLIGPTGAGKSAIGRRLADHYGMRFVDLDQAIEQQTGATIATVFEIEGEAGFRHRESALLDTLSLQAGLVLATGGGAVLDPRNRQHLRERGFVIWLQASVQQQLLRLARDTQRPLLSGVDRELRLQQMATVRTPLYADLADLALATDGDGILRASEQCIGQLDQHWKRLNPLSRTVETEHDVGNE